MLASFALWKDEPRLEIVVTTVDCPLLLLQAIQVKCDKDPSKECTCIVGCLCAVQLGAPDPWYNWGGSPKVRAQ